MAAEDAVETAGKIEAWLTQLRATGSPLGSLLRCEPHDQERRGFAHTLREICQQPITWSETARSVAAHQTVVSRLLRDSKSIVFTGSGSSEFAGACLHLGIRTHLGIPADAIPAALILTHPAVALPALRPALLVSLARSGDSPESCEAVQLYLRSEPQVRHLLITCNPRGRMVLENAGDPRVTVILLDERTNDRGLAMTSSFTNLVVAGGFLSDIGSPEGYVQKIEMLAGIARETLTGPASALADFAAAPCDKAVYLGSGSAFAAAREGALKMLEMTAGRVTTMADTPLGLRHGPMSWVDGKTAVVCFLSSDPTVRAYECDLLRELQGKGIGLRRVIVGDAIPDELITPATTAVQCAGLAAVGDSHAQPVYVLVAQLLAFFRSMQEKLLPDTPSESGVITRVVREFRIHRRPAEMTP